MMFLLTMVDELEVAGDSLLMFLSIAEKRIFNYI